MDYGHNKIHDFTSNLKTSNCLVSWLPYDVHIDFWN